MYCDPKIQWNDYNSETYPKFNEIAICSIPQISNYAIFGFSLFNILVRGKSCPRYSKNLLEALYKHINNIEELIINKGLQFQLSIFKALLNELINNSSSRITSYNWLNAYMENNLNQAVLSIVTIFQMIIYSICKDQPFQEDILNIFHVFDQEIYEKMLEITVKCFPVHIKYIANGVKMFSHIGNNAFPIITILKCENLGYTLLHEEEISCFDKSLIEQKNIFVEPFVETTYDFECGGFFEEIPILPVNGPIIKTIPVDISKNKDHEENEEIIPAITVILPLPYWIFRTPESGTRNFPPTLKTRSNSNLTEKRVPNPVTGPSSPCISQSFIYCADSRIYIPNMDSENLIRLTKSTPILNNKLSFTSSNEPCYFSKTDQNISDQSFLPNSQNGKNITSHDFPIHYENIPNIIIENKKPNYPNIIQNEYDMPNRKYEEGLRETTKTSTNMIIEENKFYKKSNEKVIVEIEKKVPLNTKNALDKTPDNKKLQQSIILNKIRCGYCKIEKAKDDFDIIECETHCTICNKCRSQGMAQYCLICNRKYTENEHDLLIAVKNTLSRLV